MIEVGMFAIVKSSGYVDYKIQKGDLVYVAGDMMVPVEENDPYLHRKLFVVAYTKDGHVNTKAKPLSMDGRNLKPVSANRQKELYAQFEKDMQPED